VLISGIFDMQARLVLEDGSSYEGYSFGFVGPSAGEVVFNTGMVGYPESLTDPSYRGQILVLTYPLIGNYGIPDDTIAEGLPTHFESDRIQVSGLIVSDYSKVYSHWSANRSLSDWLCAHRVPALCGIDTRALTKQLREKGVMLGKIEFDRSVDLVDPNTRNLVAEVSVTGPRVYGTGDKTVILIDCGAKHSIVRSLLRRGVRVVRVPWDYDIFQEKFDAVMVSNGPGDPKQCEKTILTLRRAMVSNIPLFGICLGNQLLGLAAGADTYKLPYGHRSQNQPCIDQETARCYITSQNHGYAIDARTLPQEWKPLFVNANDGTNEGIRHITKPFFSVQFHPEAMPGPLDTQFLFDRFLEMIP
jgi:carbamoyl-phosphate synthase small subunit